MMERNVYVFAGVVLACLVALHFVGCRHTNPPKAAVEAAYTTELMNCVDVSNTLRQSWVCRCEVDKRYGLGTKGPNCKRLNDR